MCFQRAGQQQDNGHQQQHERRHAARRARLHSTQPNYWGPRVCTHAIPTTTCFAGILHYVLSERALYFRRDPLVLSLSHGNQRAVRITASSPMNVSERLLAVVSTDGFNFSKNFVAMSCRLPPVSKEGGCKRRNPGGQVHMQSPPPPGFQGCSKRWVQPPRLDFVGFP